ncbi:MAG: hypothetical protein H0U61_03075 [Nocardioidaceae bacterium]|nr:hypothetical protein [Nocardioidaceae bacterium]
MGAAMVSAVVLGTAVFVALPILTILGARHRGLGLAAAVAAGIFLPITWTVWYLRDERPYRRALHHPPSRSGSSG